MVLVILFSRDLKVAFLIYRLVMVIIEAKDARRSKREVGEGYSERRVEVLLQLVSCGL